MQIKLRRKNKKTPWLLFAVLASALLLFGCDNKEHFKSLEDYILNMKRAIINKKKAAVAPVVVPAVALYQAETLREPFADNQMLAAKVGSTNPLQAYPLNMLKFVGTLSEKDTSTAYVIAPDAKLYQVKVGDNIGNHHGLITTILPDRIEVKEQDSETGKPVTERIVTLELKDAH